MDDEPIRSSKVLRDLTDVRARVERLEKIIEHLTSPCTYKVIPYPTQATVMNDPAHFVSKPNPETGAWCTKHGWYCPNSAVVDP